MLKWIIAAAVLFTVVGAFSADQEESAEKVYQEPVLLTSVGQAADVLIMKGLCLRAGIDIQVKNLATSDSLEGIKTLILVAGGSSKGLGAAKVDVSDEKSRVEDLVKTASKMNIPILTFHIGGEARRGALSDPFNLQAAEAGELIVVAGDGDKDGFFKDNAAKKHAVYRHVDKSFDVIDVLKEMFGKTKK